MKKAFLFGIMFLITISAAIALTNVRLQPDSTLSNMRYWYLDYTNLSVYYTVGHPFTPADFAGSIFYNDARNTTMPQSRAKWSFDYENRTVNDLSISGLDIDGSRHNLNVVENKIRIVKNYTFISNYTSTGGQANPEFCNDGNYATSCSGGDPGYYYGQTPVVSGATQYNITFGSEVPTGCSVGVRVWNGVAWTDGAVGQPYGSVGNVSFIVPQTSIFNNKIYLRAYTSTRVGVGSCTSSLRDMTLTVTTQNNEDTMALYFPFEQSTPTTTTNWASAHVPLNASVLNGATRNLSNCHKGACYTFDGANDFLNLSRGGNLDYHDYMTVSVWIYPHSAGISDRILSKSTGTERIAITVRGNNATHCNISTYIDYPTVAIFVSTADIPYNQWSHVVWTFSNATKKSKIFKNGKEMAYHRQQTGVGSGLTTSALIWRIGNTFDGSAGFNGNIDEFYLFNTTISNTTIQILANDSCRNSGYCYTFLGNESYLNLSSNTNLDNLADYSIGVWFRAFSDGNNNYGKFLEQMTSAGSYFRQLGLREGSGQYAKLQSYVATADVSGLHTIAYPILDGEWHHLLFTFNTTQPNGRIYLDGQPAAYSYENPGSGAYPDDSASSWIVGNDFKYYNRQFNGSLDDFTVWPVELSPAQAIMAYKNQPIITGLALGSYHAEINYTNSTGKYSVRTTKLNLTGGDLNITIYKESDGTKLTVTNVSIQAVKNLASYDFWTVSGNKTINSTFTQGTWNFVFNASGYAQRTYQVTFDQLGYYNLEAYLIDSTNSVIFTVMDEDNGELIMDALGTMQKIIGGTWTTVESKTTDITGRITYYYGPLTQYRFIFAKTGYQNLVFTLNPILFASYDIKMQRETSINESQDYDKISIVYGGTAFQNNVLKNFTWMIASPYGELTQYGYILSYPGGSITHTGSNANGQSWTTAYTIAGATINDVVHLYYYYQTPIAGLREFNLTFAILTEHINQTMEGIRDETYGLGVFERLLIAVISAVIIVGIGALIGRPLPGFVLGLLWYGYLSYIAFVPQWTVLITFFVGLIVISNQAEY